MRTSELNKIEGNVVNLETLEKANLIDRSVLRARIMLSGDVKKAVTVEGVAVTKGARAAIEKAGGKVVEAKAEAKAEAPEAKAKAKAKAEK